MKRACRAGTNAICSDAAGKVYISDSFQRIIWKTGKDGNGLSQWVPSNTLLMPGADLSTRLSAPTGSSSNATVNVVVVCLIPPSHVALLIYFQSHPLAT